MAFHSTQGQQLGLPQMIQSRPQLGYMGALLVWVVALIAYIGFKAFNQLLAAQAVNDLIRSDASAPYAPTVVFAAIVAMLAAVGYDWIHRAQRYLAGTLIFLPTVFSVGTVLTFRFAPAEWDIANFSRVPFVTQCFTAAAFQLSWSIYVSDYSRYLPRNVCVRASGGLTSEHSWA